MVACDILFPERDRYSPPVYAEALAGRDPKLAAALRALPDNDVLMAGAMADRLVVLGVAGIGTAVDGAGAQAAAHAGGRHGRGPAPLPARAAGAGRCHPGAQRGRGRAGPGHADPGRRRHRAPGAAGRRWSAASSCPSLALEAIRIAVGADKVFLRSGPSGITGISLGRTSIPVDPEGRAWVRYGLPNPDQYVRAADVLAGRVPPGRLEGHIVFIGASAAGLGDIKPAPIVGAMPGVEIQASLLQTLVSGSILRRPVGVVQIENLSLLVLGLVLAWAGPFLRAGFLPGAAGPGRRRRARRSPGTRSATTSCWSTASMSPVALAVLLFWLAMARYVREEARRRTIRNAFSRYLSPVMVDRLTTSARALKMGGERRELTVLFSDIRGFTTLSERYEDDPEGLTALLGRYFTAMTADHPGEQRHDRQVYRRRDHGVLERAPAGRAPSAHRLPRRPADARGAGGAQRGPGRGGAGARRAAPSRCGSASASTPASASSATWAPSSASTTRSSATR